MSLRLPLQRIFPALVLAAAAMLISPVAARADLFGLTIGIDDYTGSANDLSGAVNDAVVIAEALRNAGAAQVVTLVNDQANKDAIERALSALLDIAKADDIVVISYSGHGGRGKTGAIRDLVFYLGGYTPRGPGTRERILDRELARWLSTAAEASIRLILIADTGYAARLDREADAGRLRFRTAQFGALDPAEDQLQLPEGEGPTSVNALSTVMRLQAAAADAGMAEIMVGGKWHGALSVAFSRAIAGNADSNGNREITATELAPYVARAVAFLTEYRQRPVVFVPRNPDEDEEEPLVRLPEDDGKTEEASTGEAAAEAETPLPPIALLVDGDPPPGLGERADAAIVTDAEEADLIWSPQTGSVRHRLGGMIAEGIDGDAIGAVIGKWAALDILKSAALANPLDLYAASGNRTYKPGNIAQIRLLGAKQPALTLFNLAPDGRVEFLVPANAAEAGYDWTGGVFSERYRIGGTAFGADHLIAIASPAPLTELHKTLKLMASTGDNSGLAAALAAEIGKADIAVGIAGIYSVAE